MLLGHGLWEAERLAQIMSDLIFRQLPGMKKVEHSIHHKLLAGRVIIFLLLRVPELYSSS